MDYSKVFQISRIFIKRQNPRASILKTFYKHCSIFIATQVIAWKPEKSRFLFFLIMVMTAVCHTNQWGHAYIELKEWVDIGSFENHLFFYNTDTFLALFALIFLFILCWYNTVGSLFSLQLKKRRRCYGNISRQVKSSELIDLKNTLVFLKKKLQ